MPKLDASGADQMMQMLNDLGRAAPQVCSMALFKGMSVTVDVLREAIEGLPSEIFHPMPGARNGGNPLDVLTEDDREDMLEGIGIAPFEHTGNGVNSAASIEGYSRHTEMKFPNGVPLPMIARSIESGSSARQKHPYIRPAINANKGRIQEAMEQTVLECIDSFVANGTMPSVDSSTGSSGGNGISKSR